MRLPTFSLEERPMRPVCFSVAQQRLPLLLIIALLQGFCLVPAMMTKTPMRRPTAQSNGAETHHARCNALCIFHRQYVGQCHSGRTGPCQRLPADDQLSAQRLCAPGDVLFNIDPKEYQAAVDQAKAQLEVKKTQAALQLTNYQRQAYLGKKGAVSEFDVLQAKAQSDEAKAEVTAAQAELEAAQIQLDYTQVLAPIDGRINRGLVDTGNLVGSDGNTQLATIVNDDPIYAYFNVSENDLLAYRAMAKAEGKSTKENDPDEGAGRVQLQLSNEEGFPHKGDIDFMNNEMDPNTGTIQVRGVFPNTNRELLSGFFVRLRVPLGTYRNALLVPEQAIAADQQGSYVYVVGNDNKVEYRSIKTGSKEDGYVVIIKGIKDSERVIVQGLQRAKPDRQSLPRKQNPRPLPKPTPPPRKAKPNRRNTD